MIETRRPRRSLENLRRVLLDGSPPVALQRKPRKPQAPAPDVVAILDIQQIPLARPQPPCVSVLVTEEGPWQFAMGLIGNQVGIRQYASRPGDFREQVIQLVESAVYGRGRRKWFACPGLDGASCGSRRMKLYLPSEATGFACTDCHGLVVPHAPDRPMRQRDRSLSQVTLRWREPLELTVARSA